MPDPGYYLFQGLASAGQSLANGLTQRADNQRQAETLRTTLGLPFAAQAGSTIEGPDEGTGEGTLSAQTEASKRASKATSGLRMTLEALGIHSKDDLNSMGLSQLLGISKGLALQQDQQERDAKARQMDATLAHVLAQTDEAKALAAMHSRQDAAAAATQAATQRGVKAYLNPVLASVVPGLATNFLNADGTNAFPAPPRAITPEDRTRAFLRASDGQADPHLMQILLGHGAKSADDDWHFDPTRDVFANVVPGSDYVQTQRHGGQIVPRNEQGTAQAEPAYDEQDNVLGHTIAVGGKRIFRPLRTAASPELMPATVNGQAIPGIYVDATGKSHDLRGSLDKLATAEPAAPKSRAGEPVLMTDPKGNRVKVPADRVAEFRKKGYQ